MNLPPDLLDLFDQWGTLSDVEAAAIPRQDWAELARCHAAKELLQTQIDQFPHGGHWIRTPLGKEIGARLIAQEKENAAALTRQRQDSEAESSDGQAALRHLRQIHGAYGSRQQTRWHSYS